MRKSISVTFFSMVATLLVLGTAVLGCSEWLLFSRYFAQERYDTLDSVADVTQRAADYIVQQAALPKGAELDALNTKLEIIGESAEAYLFFTDEEGRILIASNPEMVGTDIVGPELMKKVAGDQPYHTLSTLDGVLTEKSYVSVRHMQDARGNNSGYLFLCSSGARLTDFKEEFWSNFFFSACVMLLCASVLTSFLMRKLTDPLQKITDAAQRFGGGDFSVRVEGVEGEGEVVDLARTFNQMAENIQSNDNSRGQCMGNIAHELRTPLAILQGNLEGMIDDVIPTDKKVLLSMEDETLRMGRLIQDLRDLSLAEINELTLHKAPHDINVLLERAVSMLQPLCDEKSLAVHLDLARDLPKVSIDVDRINQVIYNLLNNAIRYIEAGCTITVSTLAVTVKGQPYVQVQIADTGSGIAPDGFRLFRAGTDQGLGHGPGHLGRSSRRSEDMRVVIVMMIVPFFLMVGAAGKQGDALAAVGFAGFGLGQGRGESCLQSKAVHQDHVRSRHLGQVGRGRRIIMRAAGGGRDQQVEPDVFQTGHQRTGQLPDGVGCCQDMDGS